MSDFLAGMMQRATGAVATGTAPAVTAGAPLAADPPAPELAWEPDARDAASVEGSAPEADGRQHAAPGPSTAGRFERVVVAPAASAEPYRELAAAAKAAEPGAADASPPTPPARNEQDAEELAEPLARLPPRPTIVAPRESRAAELVLPARPRSEPQVVPAPPPPSGAAHGHEPDPFTSPALSAPPIPATANAVAQRAATAGDARDALVPRARAMPMPALPLPPAPRARRAAAAPPAAPIQVRIGTVEVSAPPLPAPPAVRAAPVPPAGGFDGYRPLRSYRTWRG